MRAQPVIDVSADAPSPWAFVRAKISEAEHIAQGKKAVVGIVDETHGPDLLKRARALATQLKTDPQSKRTRAAAKRLKAAAEVAVRELRRQVKRAKAAKISGEPDEPGLFEKLSNELQSWVKVLSAASGLFGGIMTLVILYGLYRFFSGR